MDGKIDKNKNGNIRSVFSGRIFFYPEIYLLCNFVTNNAIYYIVLYQKISTKNSFNKNEKKIHKFFFFLEIGQL